MNKSDSGPDGTRICDLYSVKVERCTTPEWLVEIEADAVIDE